MFFPPKKVQYVTTEQPFILFLFSGSLTVLKIMNIVEKLAVWWLTYFCVVKTFGVRDLMFEMCGKNIRG